MHSGTGLGITLASLVFDVVRFFEWYTMQCKVAIAFFTEMVLILDAKVEIN